MYLTYHEDVITPIDAILIAHVVLAEEIQDYLKNKNVVQTHYKLISSGYYLFIYLDNGDRIDVKYKD